MDISDYVGKWSIAGNVSNMAAKNKERDSGTGILEFCHILYADILQLFLRNGEQVPSAAICSIYNKYGNNCDAGRMEACRGDDLIGILYQH